ncbi:MAG: alpha/beta hydrolase [Actinomycetia bacterium]|nr:alpha/beta hydrolase [Actinomycetes bacterium]MCH9701515.1 alpha/beta hydrolase [Actinomycetes bacterium]MCH9762263.1 alpha/beta hydrolase [Actinomycetes bacterium]
MPTAGSERVTTQVGDSSIVTFVDGAGPDLVILPSYGRDGGVDYDDVTARAVADGWRVLRPQPRGVLGSVGPMEGVTFRDLAHDVAGVIAALAGGSVVVIGHAFGNLLARMVTTEHPDLVTAVALVASQAKEVPERIAAAPFVVGDPARPANERLAVLQEVFFAPGNDARVWLDGWYPQTLAMQRAAIGAVSLQEYWTCGAVPLLEVTPEHDAFKARRYWQEMRDDFGARVTTVTVAGAGHALFPEQPHAAAEAILCWARRFR